MSFPRLLHLTVDCTDPATLASFWSQALGWDVHDAHPDRVEVRSPAGGSGWLLRRAQGESSGGGLEVELASAAPQADADRLVGLGAQLLDGAGGVGVLLADPDGNRLRLLAEQPADRESRGLDAEAGDLDPGE